jgi:hypothetical protein
VVSIEIALNLVTILKILKPWVENKGFIGGPRRKYLADRGS